MAQVLPGAGRSLVKASLLPMYMMYMVVATLRSFVNTNLLTLLRSASRLREHVPNWGTTGSVHACNSLTANTAPVPPPLMMYTPTTFLPFPPLPHRKWHHSCELQGRIPSWALHLPGRSLETGRAKKRVRVRCTRPQPFNKTHIYTCSCYLVSHDPWSTTASFTVGVGNSLALFSLAVQITRLQFQLYCFKHASPSAMMKKIGHGMQGNANPVRYVLPYHT